MKLAKRLFVWVILLALLAAPTATAGEQEPSPVTEPAKTAVLFLAASASGDYHTLCKLMSSRLSRRWVGGEDCVAYYEAAERERLKEDQDRKALIHLGYAWAAALDVAEAGGKHGCLVRKGFGAKKLAKAVEKRVKGYRLDVSVRLGRGYKAAVDTPGDSIVLDSRVSCKKFTFYAESGSGDVFSLHGNILTRTAHLDKAGDGVPEPLPDPPPADETAFIALEVALGEGVAYVKVALADDRGDSVLVRLVREEGVYRVDDLFGSLTGQ